MVPALGALFHQGSATHFGVPPNGDTVEKGRIDKVATEEVCVSTYRDVLEVASPGLPEQCPATDQRSGATNRASREDLSPGFEPQRVDVFDDCSCRGMDDNAAELQVFNERHGVPRGRKTQKGRTVTRSAFSASVTYWLQA